MKLLLVALQLLVLSAFSQNPSLDWAFAMGGSDNDRGNAICIDDFGNSYVTGYFVDTVDFDPGVGVHNLTTSNGDRDVFLQKIDANGNLLWAKSFGNIDTDEGDFVGTDAAGNVYLKGIFNDTVDFDPGPNDYNLYAAWDDLFLLKLDGNGNFLWVKAWSFHKTGTFTITESGNIYLTGRYSGTRDFDPGPGVSTMTSNGVGDDFYVLKLDTDGNFNWAKTIDGTGDSFGSSAAAMPQTEDVCIAGSFQGTADFDPGAGLFNLTAIGGYDHFVLKLDSAGNFIWAKAMHGSDNNRVYQIGMDAVGNVYTTGTFVGTVDFDPGVGTFDINSGYTRPFLQKLDEDGNFVWAKAWVNGIMSTMHFTLDEQGNVYATGRFTFDVDVDPGPGIHYLYANAYSDTYVLKLDASGSFYWAIALGNTPGGSEYSHSIARDTFGSIYLTGGLSSTGDFDPGPGTYNLTSLGGGDIYVVKLERTITGVHDKAAANSLLLYPNPTSDVLTIEYDQMEVEAIHLVDVTGKIIQSYPPTTRTINMTALPQGIYYIKTLCKMGTISRKIVKVE